MLDKVNNVDCMAMVDNVDYIYIYMCDRPLGTILFGLVFNVFSLVNASMFLNDLKTLKTLIPRKPCF